MPLYSSLVRHQLQDECSWKNVQGSREFQRDFGREMEDAAFCPTERK